MSRKMMTTPELSEMIEKMMALPSSAYSLTEPAGETAGSLLEKLLQFLETIPGFIHELPGKLLQFLEGIPGFIQEKLDEILPPETRSATLHHWLVVFLTVVLPVALSLLCLYYCCKCCCCAGGGRRAAVKMMRAPGRRGDLIPRPSFEADPRGYFRDLRADKQILV